MKHTVELKVEKLYKFYKSKNCTELIAIISQPGNLNPES